MTSIPIFEVILDSHDEHNPVKRAELKVEGLPRNEAVLLAIDYMKMTGFKYEVVYVLAGHRQQET